MWVVDREEALRVVSIPGTSSNIRNPMPKKVSRKNNPL